MLLTKGDLQAIRELMQEELAPIKSDISEMKEQIINIDLSIGAIAEWADDTATVTKIPFAGGATSIG